MKSKAFSRYYWFSCIGMLLASYYPLSMGVRVLWDMIADGMVLKENYPKYIIPYTPLSVALIVGVLLMPLCMKRLGRFALVEGASVATSLFFVLELLLEEHVVVSASDTVSKLEDWQMFMCYIPSEMFVPFKTQTAVDILMGNYNPAFKLHFYLIAVVLILTILNSVYGFGQLVRSGDKKRFGALIVQSCCTVVFLGLCILACFTAFWRDGELAVSPLSATLMTVFFVLFGITAGVFIGSFLLGKRGVVSIAIPAVGASIMTLLMYVGELILLNGHVYRFGTGIVFEGIAGIALAPFDILVILLAGGITAGVLSLLNRRKI